MTSEYGSLSGPDLADWLFSQPNHKTDLTPEQIQDLRSTLKYWRPTLGQMHSQGRSIKFFEAVFDHNVPSSNTTEQLKSPDVSQSSSPISNNETEERKCATAQLKHWAIGMETGRQWWLYRNVKGSWQQYGKIDIPKGQPTTLAAALVNQHGQITRSKAIKLFPQPGRTNDEIRKKVVTPAFTKLRKKIRQCIKYAGRYTHVDDPIPSVDNPQGWRTAIEVGLVEFDIDSNSLQLKTEDY